jgi:hypothetical protein
MRKLIAVVVAVIALLLVSGTALAQTPTPYPTPTPRPTPDLSIPLPYPDQPEAPIQLPDPAWLATPQPIPTLTPIGIFEPPDWADLFLPDLPNTITLGFLPEIEHGLIPTSTDWLSATFLEEMSTTQEFSETLFSMQEEWLAGPISQTEALSDSVARRFHTPPVSSTEIVSGTTADEAVDDMNEGMMVTMDHFRALIGIQVVGPMLIAMIVAFGWMLFFNLIHMALKAIIVAIDLVVFMIKFLTDILPGF